MVQVTQTVKKKQVLFIKQWERKILTVLVYIKGTFSHEDGRQVTKNVQMQRNGTGILYMQRMIQETDLKEKTRPKEQRQGIYRHKKSRTGSPLQINFSGLHTSTVTFLKHVFTFKKINVFSNFFSFRIRYIQPKLTGFLLFEENL